MERTRDHRRRARGMTLIEVAVTLAFSLVCAIVFAAIIIAMSGPGRVNTRQLKDASQVRGVLQAFVLYAQHHGDRYPLPSTADIDNHTVPQLGTAKDTSANIYSLLLWNGLVTTELLCSPSEAGNVEKYEGYELSEPQAAAHPGKALWDPAFRADFTGNEPGGVSYAHLLPSGSRLSAWANTFDANQVTVANRGPKVNSVTYKKDGSIKSIDSDNLSVTLQFHGNETWSGNIAYNDNHVKFEKNMTGDSITYLNADGRTTPDVLFYDEPDDPTHTNTFLSLFTTAGDTSKDFTSIWD